MRIRVQVVIDPDDDEASSDPPSAVVHDVATIERGELSVDTLGMQLTEAKLLLQRVPEVLSSMSRCELAWLSRSLALNAVGRVPTRTARRSSCARCSARYG